MEEEEEQEFIASNNSRKSVRWSAVPIAPVLVLVYVSVMVRGSAAPKGLMSYA